MDVSQMSVVPEILVVTSDSPADSPGEEAAMSVCFMDTLGIPGSMCFDDYGRPFIIIKDEDKQSRLTGLEALRSHILAARQVTDRLKTSLGPRGMDKLLVSPEGEVVITNDGATILGLMDVEHEVAKLLVELAQSQDLEVGDGTTGVVVLAGALLERALELLDKGIHPTRVADGYEQAARVAARHLDRVAVRVPVTVTGEGALVQTAVTALGSKIASKAQKHLAHIAVDAVVKTCSLSDGDPAADQPQVNVKSIVMTGKTGGQIENTVLIGGVVIHSDFAHPQMNHTLSDVKVAVFSGHALHLPMVNTKHELNVDSPHSYNEIQAYMNEWSTRVVKSIVDAGAKLVVYSGKLEESIIHLFLQNGVSAVDSVPDVEMVAASVRAHVVPKVEEISSSKLGAAHLVRSIDLGTTKDKLIAIEQDKDWKIVTILVRGNNAVVVEEIKRSLQDALCGIRNLMLDNAVVSGGGAAEISCSLAVQEASLQIADVEQLAYQAFAEALDAIPMTLAQNSGLYPLQVLTELKANHNPCLGVDCMMVGENDMSALGVIESLRAKKHQIVLATQMVKMILKIDDIRGPNDGISQ